MIAAGELTRRAGTIPRLESAVVLGAGTMGAQLACLLAGSGARVRLLDLDAATASGGLDRAARLRPSPVYRADDLERIRAGGFEDLEAAVVDADWVIEAVVERLEPKRALFERIDAALAALPADARLPLISSNTSGISISRMSDGRSERFRRVFMGTHFFNPPRYARLLELIPTADTDAERVAWIEDVGSRRLGKGTVRAKDRPAFVANRLGVHGLLSALALAGETGLGVDDAWARRAAPVSIERTTARSSRSTSRPSNTVRAAAHRRPRSSSRAASRICAAACRRSWTLPPATRRIRR